MMANEPSTNNSSDWEEIMNRDILLKRLESGDQTLPSASMGTVVTCNIIGYFLEEPPQFNCDSSAIDLAAKTAKSAPFEKVENERFKVGEGDAFPALELAIRHSRVGDIFILRCNHRFAFGYNGRDSTIPPNMDLEYEVSILSQLHENEIDHNFVRAQIDAVLRLNSGKFNIPLPENLDDEINSNHDRWSAFEDLSFRKEAGNRWFKYKDFGRAARAYSKGTKVADDYFKSIDKYQSSKSELVKMGEDGQMQINPNYDGDKSQTPAADDDRDLVIFLTYVACLNNLAACYLEMGEQLKARDMCIKVLEIDPYNIKALFRAAKSSLALHNYEESEVCINQLLQLDPDNKAAKAESIRIKKAKKDYNHRSKEISKAIASKLFPSSASSSSKSSNSNNSSSSNKSDNNMIKVVDSPDSIEGEVSASKEESGMQSISQQTMQKDEKESSASVVNNSIEAATNTGSKTPFVFLLATSVIVLVLSLVIAVFIAYQKKSV